MAKSGKRGEPRPMASGTKSTKYSCGHMSLSSCKPSDHGKSEQVAEVCGQCKLNAAEAAKRDQ